jgi:protein-tyrosine-phosphatase/predicted ATP-grasp superfamily ATP-dependent carboligase
MPVLILDGHSPAAVETLQSLGRAGMPVDVCADRERVLAFSSRYVRRRLRQPDTADAEGFQRWLKEIDDAQGYELIVPSTEKSLAALRRLEEMDPLRQKAVLPSNRALDVALDKQATWRLAEELGIPVPASVLIDKLDRAPPAEQYPVVLKPIRSKVMAGGQLTYIEPRIVTKDADRRAVLEMWLPLVPVQQQTYVPGVGIGVEMCFERGRRRLYFVHERVHEWPLTGGASTYRRSVRPDPAMLDAAERFLTALDWHGVAMVEFKRTPDGGIYLIEVNPRLWGSLALAIDAGVDFPLALALLARGKPVPPQPDYRTPYYTRNLGGDLRWMWENLRADHTNRLLMTRSPARSGLEYLRPFVGLESWDHFDWRDPAVTLAVFKEIARHAGRGGSTLAARWLLGVRLRAMHAQVLKRATCLAPIRTILFVCQGNICRSPFAELLARKKLPAYRIVSGGFHPAETRRTPPHVVRAARRLDVDMTGHRSRRISPAMVDAADLILVMDPENYQDLRRRFPHALGRSTLLGLFAARRRVRIRDPNDLEEERAFQSLSVISEATDRLARWLERVADGGQARRLGGDATR